MDCKPLNENVNCMNLTNSNKRIAQSGLLLLLIGLLATSCKKSFLDVVPDNVATIDHAFASKSEAEKYLFTCYSYLPDNANPQVNPGFVAGDECWIEYPALRFSDVVWRIGRGQQNTVSPLCNYMEGENGASSYYKAIRDCNLFLENISDKSKARDLDDDLRERWIGEVQFLKAFYHFMLFRAYGPIPVTDKNVAITSSIDEVRVKRQPVDSVVNYIAALLDTAAARLPLSIQNKATELGRITRPVALSVKAKLLVTAASPLFNGNSDYGSFKDKDGVALFNPAYSVEKWQRATTACKEAIDLCESLGIQLYTFSSTYQLSDTTKTQMSIRNAMCEKWNSELVWGLSNSSTRILQTNSAGHFDPNNSANTGAFPQLGPTLKIAKLFYTKNGVPINEDKTLDFSDIAAIRKATHEERFNLIENYSTARLNFDREPRFYADLGFDGGVWYMANSPSKTDENTWVMKCRVGSYGSAISIPVTGYFTKKALNWNFEWNSGNGVTVQEYPWPEIRLADLYLLYAESLNEAQGPAADVYEYVNRIRARAGLQSVESSWSNYSTSPSKYTTKEGMRSIIQQERSIELCFEGHRYWDLLRWKRAGEELNGNIQGWDRSGDTPELYYRPITFFSQRFIVPRDYLWPIKETNLPVNPNLVQNPNW